MSKDKVVYKVGKFTDFTGLEREVVFCAISVFNPECWVELENSEIADIPKGLYVGVAVQSPSDKIANTELAKVISKGKAVKIKSRVATIYTTNSGTINSKVVSALLEQELDYFCKNPGKYLKGYNKDAQLYKSNPEEYKAKFGI